MGLYLPGLARRGVAVLALRGVLTEAGAGRLTAPLRRVFAADPDLLIVDLGGLRGWDDCGQRLLADVAAYLAARGGQMVLSTMGAHLRRSEPRLAALQTFPDVPAILAAGNTAPPPGRRPRMRPGRPWWAGRGDLLHHAYHVIPSRAGQAAVATRWAGAVLTTWGVPGHADAAVAGLAELVANGVAHGFGATIDITVRLWAGAGQAGWLTVGVHDENPAPPVWRAPAAALAEPAGGWGLLIMASCAHAHGWYPDTGSAAPGKTVWFARHIQPPRAGERTYRSPPACS
jgi:anti-anti-sigma regulatory factor